MTVCGFELDVSCCADTAGNFGGWFSGSSSCFIFSCSSALEGADESSFFCPNPSGNLARATSWEELEGAAVAAANAAAAAAKAEANFEALASSTAARAGSGGGSTFVTRGGATGLCGGGGLISSVFAAGTSSDLLRPFFLCLDEPSLLALDSRFFASFLADI